MTPRGDGWYKERGAWRHRYVNADGRRAEFIGYSDKGLSKTAFARALDEVKEIRYRRLKGLPVIDERPLREIIADYLTWGRREGGRHGRPWSDGQRKNAERYIPRLVEKMGVGNLEAITLAKFETALAAWETPKSRGIIGGLLKAMLNWCARRDMLDKNPLRNWSAARLRPTSVRRALTLEEVDKLLQVAPQGRAMAYECAIYSGARSREFNHFTVSSVKWERGGIYLPAEASKNRKEHFFFLPAEYLERLRAYTRYSTPTAPLFRISLNHKARYFHQDCEKAGIPIVTDEGFVDFHALRTTFETFLGQTADSARTLLEVGRHSDLNTNVRVYQRTNDARKREAVEGIAGLRHRHQEATGGKTSNA